MNYNEQYYIAEQPPGDDQIYLKPDKRTANRGYHYKQLPQGDNPLFFMNGYREKDNNRWPIPHILMDGGDLIVIDDIRNELKKYDIDGMQLYPAVYIDDHDKWHENYWFLNFYQELDCWDRERSIYHRDIDVDPDSYAEVDKYYLDEKILDPIPEERRLMFRVGDTSMGHIFIHQKIVDFIIKNKFTGVRFFKVSDFKEGDQYRP